MRSQAPDLLRLEHDVVVVEAERLRRMPVVEADIEHVESANQAATRTHVKLAVLRAVAARAGGVGIVERPHLVAVYPDGDAIGLILEFPFEAEPFVRGPIAARMRD